MVLLTAGQYNVFIVALSVSVTGAMIGLALGLIWNLKRKNLLQSGLIHVVFLKEKQRNFLIFLAGLGSCFMGSGLAESLYDTSVISQNLQIAISGVTFIGGAAALFLIILTSPSPRRLTEDQKASLAWLPVEYYPMALGPVSSLESLG